MKEQYIKAVTEGNLWKARMMLADELLLDPRGRTFEEMLAYTKAKLPGLFEADRGSNYKLPPDRNTWDEDLRSIIKQDLISNFSVKKLEEFKKVAMEVGKEKARKLDEEGKGKEEYGNGRKEEPGNECVDNGLKTTMDKRTVGTISLCGGAALSIAGLCVGGCIAKTLLCLTGGTAIVAGTIALLSKENNKE